jgi:hypothetical protein
LQRLTTYRSCWQMLASRGYDTTFSSCFSVFPWLL